MKTRSVINRSRVRLAALFILFTLFPIGGRPQTPSPSVPSVPLIGVIKKALPEECGCLLQLSPDYRKHNRRAIFRSDFSDKAWMNLDGKDLELSLVSPPASGRRERVGARRNEIYKSGSYKIEIQYVTTRICPPKDESCEAVWYSAMITVTKNGLSGKIKTIGLCGC